MKYIFWTCLGYFIKYFSENKHTKYFKPVLGILDHYLNDNQAYFVLLCLEFFLKKVIFP